MRIIESCLMPFPSLPPLSLRPGPPSLLPPVALSFARTQSLDQMVLGGMERGSSSNLANLEVLAGRQVLHI